MTTFLKVGDKIQELSQGKIQKKTISPLIAIVFMIIAIPLLWMGGKTAFEQNVLTFFYSILGGLFLFMGMFFAIIPPFYYVYVAENRMIRPQRINLSITHQTEILRLLEENKIKEVYQYATNHYSPLFLEIWWIDSHQDAYWQLLLRDKDKIIPLTMVGVCNLSAVKK